MKNKSTYRADDLNARRKIKWFGRASYFAVVHCPILLAALALSVHAAQAAPSQSNDGSSGLDELLGGANSTDSTNPPRATTKSNVNAGSANNSIRSTAEEPVKNELGTKQALSIGTQESSKVDGDSNRPDAIKEDAKGSAKVGAKKVVSKSENRLAISEIIVTAEKRAENIQDVPIAIAAFSGAALDAKGVTSAKQLQLSVPGLNYGNIAGFSIIYLRGVGNDVFVPGGSPSVAYYVDGLYFPYAGSLGQDLGEVQRLEVLKGPQGTLFGRNTTAGAINVITKDPTADFEANAHFTYESFDTIKSKAYVAGPVTDNLFGSVSFLEQHGDSIYTQTDPAHYGDKGGGFLPNFSRGYRGKLLWKPTDHFQAKLTGYQLRSEGADGALLVAYKVKPLGQLLGVTPAPSPYRNNINAETKNVSRTTIAQLDLQYDFDDFTVKTITGYQNIGYFASTDYDGSQVNLLTFQTPTFDHNFSQEVQILSNDGGDLSSLFGKPFTWIVGGYYFQDKTGFDPNDFIAADQAQVLGDLPLFSTPVSSLGGQTLAQYLNPNVAIRFFGILGIQSYAGYTQESWQVLDWLKLTAGARIQHEQRKNLNSSTFLHADAQGIMPDIPVTSFPERTIAETNVSPKFAIDVKPWENTLFYASYSKGFKSGTLNTVALLIPPQTVKPEVQTTFEVGTKNELFDDSLIANLALYHNEIKNGQIFFISVLSGGVANLENAGEYITEGADLDLTWQPSEHWVFSGSVSYINGTFKDYVGSAYNQTTGLLESGASGAGVSFAGNQTTRSPRWTESLSASYSFHALGGEWEATAEGYNSSHFFFDAQNVLPQKSYHIINARLSYLFDRFHLRTTIFGTDLTNTIYANIRYQSDFASLQNLAPPREFGVQFDWTY